MAKKFLSPLNLLNLTSDPGTAAEGDFYWNSSTNKLRIYFDGAWSNIDALPSQTGNSGEFLVTNGTSASWSNTITANAANTQALIVKGIASQSADIQQWQDSGGTTQGYVVAGGNQIYFPGIFASYNMQANSGGAAVVPLIVKGFASQSANLQQWQDSSGNVLTAIGSSGRILSKQRVSLGFIVESPVVDAHINLGNDYQSDRVVVLVRGANSQTANLQEWQDATPNTVAYINNGGGAWFGNSIGIGATPYAYSSMVSISTSNVGNKGLVIRGLASQTANLQEWQDSAGTVLASVSSAGHYILGTGSRIVSKGGTAAAFLTSDGGVLNAFRIDTAAAGNVGLQIIGRTSQTADLQHWSDVNGNVLTRVNAAGIVAIGGTPRTMNLSLVPTLQVEGTTASSSYAMVMRNSNDVNYPRFTLAKSRGTTVGSLTAVTTSDVLGSVEYQGTDGAALNVAARIEGAVDASISSGIVPGRLSFYTTSSAGTSTERLRIDSAGLATFYNDVTVTGNLTINGTTTNINTTNLVVEDKNIILGDVTTPSNTTADGGGITLKGATDKTFNWVNSTGAWTSSEPIIANSFIPSSSTVPTNGIYLPAANTLGFATNSTSKIQINSIGETSIGGTPSGGTTLAILRSATGSTSMYGIYSTETAASDVTSLYTSIRGRPRTAAASFTLNSAVSFESNDIVKGAGSTVTNHIHYYVNATTTSASNVYGFRSDLNAAANVYNLYMNGTAANYFAGQTAIGSAAYSMGNGGVAQMLGVTSSSATNIGIVVRGAASQTADLQQWQDSSGNVLASINSSGLFNNSTTTGIITKYIRIGGSGYLGTLSLSPETASTIGLVVRGAASQTANLQEWQDSSGTVKAYIGATGGINNQNGGDTRLYNLGIGGSSSGISWLYVTPANASEKPVVIRGVASQSANLQEWQNSAGTVLAGISSVGYGYFGTTGAASAAITAKAPLDNFMGIIVRPFSASQTANLQEWQNNSGTAVATMSAAGAFTAITKSFDIPHPTKENMRLRYGSLEGPENGVYVRGRSKQDYIALPDHWKGLVDEDTITVNITPVGKKQDIYVDSIEDNKVYLGGKIKEYFFTVYGERKDVDKLTVEY